MSVNGAAGLSLIVKTRTPSQPFGVPPATRAAPHSGLAMVVSTAKSIRSATPVAVPVPQDRVVLGAVTREVTDQARRLGPRDVEDLHAAAGSGAGRETGGAGVVAHERVVAPEREVRVGRLGLGREHLVHPLAGASLGARLRGQSS